MLKCMFDRDKLNIIFDIPIPPQCQGHKEFVSFSKLVSRLNHEIFIRDNDKNLTGMMIGKAQLESFVHVLLPEPEAKLQLHFFNRIIDHPVSSKALDAININFHQNTFDKPERYWNFNLSQGYFPHYFFNRINWFLGPKNGVVTDFPLHVDIESASTCNMNCPMCYRDGLAHSGQMDLDLFKKAVDECEKYNVFSIRLSWRGETLTHPRIKEMIRYATRRIKNVSFLTNAFYLNREMAECFIDAKLSYVAVSFDGIGDIYEKIRHPAKFTENFNNLSALKKLRAKKNSCHPQIRLCTIWPAVKEDPNAYRKTMTPVSDYMVCNPYINFKGPMIVKNDFVCQYPWERIVIGYNGETQCCTGWNADDIILGNIQDKSIYEMWHSKQMDRIREIHSQGLRMDLSSCAQCRHGAQGDPDISIDAILERNH